LSNRVSAEIRASVNRIPNAETVLNEAEFGYGQIREYLARRPEGASVLEVGSGPCVLLSQLKHDYPGFEVTGIEPIGPGFDKFEQTLETLLKKYGFDLFRGDYESFDAPRTFDLIFSINVFEHLPDWRHFLRFVKERLAPDGKCVILCPNYGFPYESHFGLPIVLNKRTTYRLFSKQIERHELENDCEGLWSSLNFVTWGQVSRYAPTVGLDIEFDTTVLRTMIERLSHDEAFAQRQAKVARLANLALRTGLVKPFEWPVLRTMNPYLKLVITRSGA
jgi:SAM-dependent methyltransferase